MTSTQAKASAVATPNITVRPLSESDLPAADRIFRVAFGTFLGLPEPAAFMGDAGFVATRWRTDPDAAFAAVADGGLAGSNFATNWGSVGFFGPLTVRPDLWDRGVGTQLMEPVMDCFDRWDTTLAGLFTFPHSQKHIGLYQRFGFWPRFLTALMSRGVATSTTNGDAGSSSWTTFSTLPNGERETTLAACREMTDAIYGGLDLTGEIQAVAQQKLGDTVLLRDDGGVSAFAVCHHGPGSEGGSGTCYIKFGAARPGPRTQRDFALLLDACEAMAAARALRRMVAGVNASRHEAFRAMRARGYRADIYGVAMQRPNESGYNRSGVYLIDDWR